MTPAPTATPTAGPSPTGVPSPIVTTYPVSGTSLSIPFPSIATGYSGSIAALGLTLSNPASTVLQSALSLGTPPVLSLAIHAPTPVVAYTGSNGTAPTVLSYAELTPSSDLSVGGQVTLTFGFPAGTLNPSVTYLYAIWFGQLQGLTPSASWFDGNATTTVDFPTQTITIVATPNYTFRGGYIYGFAIYHN